MFGMTMIMVGISNAVIMMIATMVPILRRWHAGDGDVCGLLGWRCVFAIREMRIWL